MGIPRRAGVALILVLASGLAAPPALAHAALAAWDPPPGATLAQAPDRVEVEFASPIARGVSCLEVRAEGRMLSRACDVDPSRTSTLAADVPPAVGRHEVSWTILGYDGHARTGGYAYDVGGEGGAPARVTQSAASAVEVTLRALFALGLATSIGAPIFLRSEPALARRGVRLGAGAAALAAVAGLGFVLSIAGRLGVDLLVLARTFPGGVAIARMLALALAALLFALAIDRAPRWARRATVLAAIAAALGVLTSHAVVGSPYAHGAHAGLFLGPVHVVAAISWTGAVAGLLLAGPDAAGTIVRRASRWARVAVIALAASGIALAALASRDPGELLAGPQGALLAVKSALFAGALGFGAWHERRLAASASITRRGLVMEAAILALALLAAGALAATPAA